MLVLVPSATHIWEKVIPGGGVHCHWKEPSLATVQERFAADTTLSGPCGTGSSMEGGCRNVTGRRKTNERDKCIMVCIGDMTMLLRKAIRYNISSASYNFGGNLLQPTLKCDSSQTTTTSIGPLMCPVWVVNSQDTPNARLRGVTSILNHVTTILYCDGENRVIHEHITTKLPGDGRRLLHEVAIQLTCQSGRRVTNGYCQIQR